MTTQPDPTIRERLRELAEPGPWHVANRGIGWSVHTGPEPANGDHWNPPCPDITDWDMLGKGVFLEPMARIIVEAVNALPKLDTLERRVRAAEGLTEAVDAFLDARTKRRGSRQMLDAIGAMHEARAADEVDIEPPECVADGSHSDDLSHASELENRTGRHAISEARLLITRE